MLIKLKGENMDINKILNLKCNDDRDVLSMIISNNIDYGSESGAYISSKQFPKLIDEIIMWSERYNEKK